MKRTSQRQPVTLVRCALMEKNATNAATPAEILSRQRSTKRGLRRDLFPGLHPNNNSKTKTRTKMSKDFPPRSFPDPPAINYALEYARGTKNAMAEKHLLRLQERSNAFCNGYGTHIPLLASVVATAPAGDVLE